MSPLPRKTVKLHFGAVVKGGALNLLWLVPCWHSRPPARYRWICSLLISIQSVNAGCPSRRLLDAEEVIRVNQTGHFDYGEDVV